MLLLIKLGIAIPAAGIGGLALLISLAVLLDVAQVWPLADRIRHPYKTALSLLNPGMWVLDSASGTAAGIGSVGHRPAFWAFAIAVVWLVGTLTPVVTGPPWPAPLAPSLTIVAVEALHLLLIGFAVYEVLGMGPTLFTWFWRFPPSAAADDDSAQRTLRVSALDMLLDWGPTTGLAPPRAGIVYGAPPYPRSSSGSDWQRRILRALESSAFAVLQATEMTPSLEWELETARRALGPHRTIVVAVGCDACPVATPGLQVVEQEASQASIRRAINRLSDAVEARLGPPPRWRRLVRRLGRGSIAISLIAYLGIIGGWAVVNGIAVLTLW